MSKSTFADEGTSISLNRTTRDENNVAKLGVVATDNYIWTGQIPQTVGKAYKLTFYVLVQEANGLVFDVRNTKSDIATPIHDNLLAAGAGTKFTAKVDDVISTASFTAPTDGWKKVEITWEADTADNIRMILRCSGSGTVYVDDWVLYTYEVESPVTNNTPNASDDYLGNIVASENFEAAPAGTSYTYVTPFSGAAWVEGKNALKVPVTGEKDYLYTIRIAETAGHNYEMSFYVWVEKASNLVLDVRRTNTGYNATVTDKLLTASGYTATINGVAATGSISAVTSGWQKVVIKWTATQTTNSSSTGERFAIRAYGSGTGTVWIDDFIIKDTTKAGTFGMDAGTVSLPQGDAGAQYTNIPMTEGSLEGLTSEAYMQIMYAGTESAYVEFTGFTKEDAQAVDFRMYAIRTAAGDKVFQIQWKTLEISVI